MIIAKKVRIIQKNGMMKQYTHVEEIKTYNEINTGLPLLYIRGENDDEFGMRRMVHDRFIIKDILVMDVEFHIPRS